MSEASQVSLAFPMSAHLAAIFRAQGFVNLLGRNAFERHKGMVPAEEEGIILRLEEGLNIDRFELHGHLSSNAVGDVLALFNDLWLPSSFETYFDDVCRFGEPVEQQEFRSMSTEQRQALQEEAAALGKQLLALRKVQLSFLNPQN